MNATAGPPRNEFKRALTAGRTQHGLWLGLTDPVCIEIAAGSGFDWICLDAEHAPFTIPSLLTGLQAAAAYPTHTMVRVAVGNPTVIKQTLDLGFQTIVVPMVESATQARDLVAAVRYPPAGIRGIGTAVARAARWNRTPEYVARANDEICLVLQMETARGLEALPEIARIEGVDALFIGPADLAASLGHPGHANHPEVRTAMRSAFATIRGAGRVCGSIATDPALAREYAAEGCNFLAVGIDTVLYANATSRLAKTWSDPGGG
jgi:4-hydroxy-2-oxoheptanedioate aldolase